MSLITKIFSHIFKDRQSLEKTLQIDQSKAMELALDISGNHVMCLDLLRNCVYDLHGKALFGNNVGIEVCYTYIHPDDRQAFRTFIERLRQGIDKEAECRYRWNYNYTGKGEPDWHNMHSHAIAEYTAGSSKPVNIIATLTDETDVLRKEREAQRLSERYSTIFENSIVGLSFYRVDGKLIRSNRIMREICHFDSDDGDEYFSNVNLFDVQPFNEVLDRNNVEEFWACSLSVVPERDMHVYLEIRVQPVIDADGNMVYLSVAARDISAEREMYHQAKRNDLQLKQVNEHIQLYEYELRYMMQACEMQAWRISLERDCIEFYSGLSTVFRTFSLADMRRIFVNQEDDFVKALANPAEALSKPLSYIGQMYPVVTRSSTELQWVQINCIPEYDEKGVLKGSFGVWRNINDLMQKQDKLREETKRANESGRKKTEFLANMTHEIRTPLNAIVGFSEVLPTLNTSEERQEIIQVIMSNCDMLLRLMNDILAASSIDADGMQIFPERVDFSKSFDQWCESLKLRIQEPQVEFLKDNPYPHFVTTIDESRLHQVVINFLTNAVKYTHQGHIRLGYRAEVRDDKEGLYIYCEDTGEGISPEMQEKIFERFFKVNDFVQGTGLGLPICKAIAKACNGTIGVESEGKDKGSTFWIWIPCKRELNT